MKKIITTTKAPTPIGPYNQAILHNGLLYTSGQIALHPETMELVLGDIVIETKQVMKNINALLEAAHMTFENVIKASIFVCNITDFNLINDTYKTYFNEATAPVREVLEVSNLPKSAKIKISIIASK